MRINDGPTLSNNKKIVWLVPEVPYPPNTGGRLLVFRRLEKLAEMGYEIHLFAIARPGGEDAGATPLGEFCSSVRYYERPDETPLLYMKSLLSSLPYAVKSRNIPNLLTDVEEYLLQGDVAGILVDFPQMLNALPEKVNIPIVLNQHNCEWMTMRSLAKELEWPRSFAFRIDSIKLQRYESRCYKKHPIKAMTFVTEADHLLIDQDASFMSCICRPGGDDHGCISKLSGSAITFVANFTYSPNINGAAWLINEVMPIVWQYERDATLRLVGKDPAGKAKELTVGDKRIEATGTVDSLQPYYEDARILALPIFEGGGIKMKTLEAASTIRPIVATANAAYETGLEDGEHYLQANDPISFAACILALLEDEPASQRLASKCRNHYEQNLTWEKANLKWSSFVDEIICA